MMYGFGDDKKPRIDTTELMEQFLVEYISNLSSRVINRSMRGGSSTMQLGDVVYYLRTDPKKYYRIPQILDVSKVMNRTNI